MRDNSDIPLGKGCCDNVFLYRIFDAGYNAGCPSSEIKAYHNHISKYRTYQEYTNENGHGSDRVKGQHMYILPSKLQEKYGREFYDLHHPLYTKKYKDYPGFKLSSEIIKFPWNTQEYSLSKEEERLLEEWKRQEKEIFMFRAIKNITKVSLFVSYWQPNNKERRDELNFCIQKNINNPIINKIYAFCEEPNLVPLHPKIKEIRMERRPTFKEYFDKINEMHSEISIIANADIYFDESLAYIKYIKGNDCFALTRWEGTENAKYFEKPDSQDVWIFRGLINPSVHAEFELGRLGSDNRLAHELKKVGYTVSNPSKSIKAYHAHKKASVHDHSRKIPPPYEYLPSSIIKPFLSIVTRHFYKRPELFKRCCESISQQTDQDFEHIIIKDEISVGSHQANTLFHKNKEKVNGEYVFMLDDDDVLTSGELISDIKKVVVEHQADLIFIKMLAGGQIIPSDEIWMKNEIKEGHIGTSCVVVKNELWKEHIEKFSAKQTGDFEFIKVILKKAQKIVWLDGMYSKTIQVSHGAEELKEAVC